MTELMSETILAAVGFIAIAAVAIALILKD
jgi:hypothetical protein